MSDESDLSSIASDNELDEGTSVIAPQGDEGLDDSMDDSLDEGEDDDDDDDDDEDDDDEEDDVGDDEVDDEADADADVDEEGVADEDDDLGDEDDEGLVSDVGADDDDDDDLPPSSDDDADANFKVEDDDDLDEPEEQATPVVKKRGLSLKIKLPNKEDTPGRDDTDLEDNRPRKYTKKQQQLTPQPSSAADTPLKRKVGRPRKATINYNEDIDDQLESDSENIIPTPSLDDELLLTDEETEYTPDITKMTERQRAKLVNDNMSDSVEGEEVNKGKLLALSNDVSKRRVLTEEENQLRKAEIARKRKNLTERKLEEEKQDTINKLLKRRAGKASAAQMKEDEEVNLKDKPRRPQIQHEALFSWVSKKDMEVLRVPEALIAEKK